MPRDLRRRESHYIDVIMSTIASQINSLTIVYSTVYSGIDHRKHQTSASLAFVKGIHRWPVNSPHKGPVTRKMFPFDDVIMLMWCQCNGNGLDQLINYIMNECCFEHYSFRGPFYERFSVVIQIQWKFFLVQLRCRIPYRYKIGISHNTTAIDRAMCNISRRSLK